jgi:glycosyltransferase involved in cell wall biosynthesis
LYITADERLTRILEATAMRPAISLITPTRNRPELLLRTIKNVQLQSLKNWQMVVVDDGDGMGIQVAQSLKDARVLAVSNAGSGQVDARNYGLDLANADLIHLLDDDDRWLDATHLEKVIAELNNQKCLLYRGGWLVLEDQLESGWVESERRKFNPVTTPESLRRDNTLLTSGVSYPKSLHEEFGGFDCELGNYWDWDWWLQVTSKYPLLNLPEPTVLMSWRGSNTSRNPLEPGRVGYLQRLCAKHGLGKIQSKNHATVLELPVLV